MSEMKDIPIETLFIDKGACVTDIEVCKWALLLGETEYSDGKSIDTRLHKNEQIIVLIDAELERRLNEL